MTILACSFLLLAAGASALATPQGGPLVCELVLAEERLERDDLELNVQLMLSEREAAAKIFDLVEALWKNEAIQEIVFLRAKHERDATRIDHDRARHALEQKEASLEHLAAACEAPGGSGSKADTARRKAEKAFERYRLASCEVLADDERRAATDLLFSEALLESVRDLRANNVATEQDVILAQRDVEKVSKRLEQSHRRVESCREEAKLLRPAG
jgi:hypothetical protein